MKPTGTWKIQSMKHHCLAIYCSLIPGYAARGSLFFSKCEKLMGIWLVVIVRLLVTRGSACAKMAAGSLFSSIQKRRFTLCP